MLKHISAFCTRTLPCGRGWFTVSCDMQQRGAWEWENLRLSVYGWVCMRWGEGAWESPFHCIAPSKCRLREIQKEEGSRELGHHGRERSVCVSQRELVQSPCLLLYPSLHPAPSALPGLVSTREGPLPPYHCKAPSLVMQFLHQHHRPPSFQTLYSGQHLALARQVQGCIMQRG